MELGERARAGASCVALHALQRGSTPHRAVIAALRLAGAARVTVADDIALASQALHLPRAAKTFGADVAALRRVSALCPA